MGVDFEPKIVAFMCNWCTYAGADSAGVARLPSPANILPIRVMCSGRRLARDGDARVSALAQTACW